MNTILFAYRIEDGISVDASSVPRGRNCGCICQSCSAPLIARQGEIRTWHFAHATNDSSADEVCEYSPLVSIRLMAHQILGDLNEIALPPASDDSDAAPRIVSIDQIETDKRFEETTVDALATIKGVPLVMYMTYKSRPIPTGLLIPTQQKAGVLEINTLTLLGLLRAEYSHQLENSPFKAQSYSDKLMWILTEDTTAKKWIYHPRQVRAASQQNKKSSSGIKLTSLGQLGIAERKPPDKPAGPLGHAAPVPHSGPLLARYECQNCSETWIAGYDDEKAKSCPICKQRKVSMKGLPR